MLTVLDLKLSSIDKELEKLTEKSREINYNVLCTPKVLKDNFKKKTDMEYSSMAWCNTA